MVITTRIIVYILYEDNIVGELYLFNCLAIVLFIWRFEPYYWTNCHYPIYPWNSAQHWFFYKYLYETKVLAVALSYLQVGGRTPTVL